MFRYEQNHQTPWNQHFSSSQYWNIDYQQPATAQYESSYNSSYQPTTTISSSYYPVTENTPATTNNYKIKEFPQQIFNQEQDESMVNAELCDQDLWQQFSDVGTEMILTKTGRRIFPGYRVKFSNLDPNASYCVLLDVISVDQNRYRFQCGNWIVAGVGEPQYPNRYYVHPSSPCSGKKLMENITSFHKAKLTNSSANKADGKFILHSMHRYQLRVHIVRSDNVQNAHMQRMRTFQFPQTTFITVTAYQNSELSQLKIANNPFARGFRPDGARGKKKFQQCNDDIIEYDITQVQKKACVISSVDNGIIAMPVTTYIPTKAEVSPVIDLNTLKGHQNHFNFDTNAVYHHQQQYSTTINSHTPLHQTDNVVPERFQSPPAVQRCSDSQFRIPIYEENYNQPQVFDYSTSYNEAQPFTCQFSPVCTSSYVDSSSDYQINISQAQPQQNFYQYQVPSRYTKPGADEIVDLLTNEDPGYASASPAEFLDNDDVTKFLFEVGL